MTIAASDTIRNEMVQRFQVNIDGGPAAGTLDLYTATQPTTAGATITTQTLLATLTFSDPSAGSASGGVLTMSSITSDSSADATGTATWGRAEDSTGTFCFDHTAGTGSEDLVLNNAAIQAGATVSCSSFTITAGNS